jgi:hypothetical protein
VGLNCKILPRYIGQATHVFSKVHACMHTACYVHGKSSSLGNSSNRGFASRYATPLFVSALDGNGGTAVHSPRQSEPQNPRVRAKGRGRLSRICGNNMADDISLTSLRVHSIPPAWCDDLVGLWSHPRVSCIKPTNHAEVRMCLRLAFSRPGQLLVACKDSRQPS